jgi:hypothetical protein
VAVPGPGKLTATAKGVRASSRHSKGRGILTLTLTAKRHGGHPGRVKLTFIPTRGAKLTATAAVKLRR